MRPTRLIALTGALFMTLTLAAPSAWAIPAFARKHNLACSSCHTAMPYVNATGRAYKEAGFRIPDEDGLIDLEEQPSQEISRNLWLDSVFPIAARVKSYTFDKRKDSDLKIRPVHEFEIFSAGSFWKTGSFFVEVEGEDEEEFSLVAAGEIGWHPHRAANFKVGIGSIFHPDPYDSLLDGGARLTVSHKLPLDIGNSVNARFRKDAQFITFYGRTNDYGKKNSLYYSFGVSAGNKNFEGEDPQDFLARVAYDFTPDVTLGGFYFAGKRDIADQEIDLARWGVDFNLGLEDFYVLGMIMNAEEDYKRGSLVTDPEVDQRVGKEDNVTGYVEAYYTMKKDGRPLFVPLVRYEWTQLDDGAETLAAITAQLGFYVVENAKVALEVYSEVDVPGSREKSNRTTLLLDIAF